MNTLYPEISPFKSFFLETSSQHRLYVEQAGNPNGIPVIFLHGGPCSGCKPEHRCFFDPARYHIILMDQRGCGRSLPFGELQQNNTQAIISDLEQLRDLLNIAQWLLFGGSWGAALALLYAQTYPERVNGLVLRGVFLARQQDLDWFMQAGVNKIYPEVWQQLADCVAPCQHEQLINDLHTAIMDGDSNLQQRIVSAWAAWGAQVALAQAYQAPAETPLMTEQSLKQTQMEIEYAYRSYFLSENQLIDNCHKIQHIPTLIIHGRYDLVCPIEAAITLKQALPQAEINVLPNAGHIAQGEEMIDALISATELMADRLSKLN